MTAKFLAGVLLAANVGVAQTTPGRLSFEVASIKAVDLISMKTGGGAFNIRIGTQIEGDRVDMNMVSLPDIICQAYGLKSYQVTGPDLSSRDRYEIHAKMPAGTTKDQVPEMLQSLLTDRFQFTFHREKKDHQVYVLSVGKNGSKLKEVEPDPPPAAGGDGAPARSFSTDKGGITTASGGQPGTVTFSTQSGSAKMPDGGRAMHVDRKMTMPALCDFLSRYMDRPVVDMTGMSALYQVVMDIPTDDLLKMARQNSGNMVVIGNPEGGAARDSAAEPADNSALVGGLQQMGLKLEARKAPMDFLVVDHAAKTPTGN